MGPKKTEDLCINARFLARKLIARSWLRRNQLGSARISAAVEGGTRGRVVRPREGSGLGLGRQLGQRRVNIK